MNFGVLGVGVWGSGFGVWGLGFGVWGLELGVWGLGFGVWGSGFGRIISFSNPHTPISKTKGLNFLINNKVLTW